MTKLPKKTFFAGLFGNALEWYDFILYANFAPIIATLFFPTKNTFISLLLTFVVFATGFLVRPLGAIIFGYIGDHIGRKAALVTSISIITLPTLMIGILPTYKQVGVIAPLLLTILRLFQGLAVSGELNTATTFLIEHSPSHRRGLAGSLVMGAAFLGMLIGAITASLMTTILSANALYSWGWRLPFLLGGMLGFVGFCIRLRVKESPKFINEIKEKNKPRFRELLFKYKKELLLTILLTCIMAVGNYIFIAFVLTFLVKLQGFSLRDANIINLISMGIILVLFPIFGLLSDKIGRKSVFKIGLWGFILFSLPIFWLLTQKSFAYALIGDILLSIILAPIAALIPTILAEIFPTRIRNTGTALGYNLCLALFGGTAPLLALSLVKATNSNYAPAIYLIICALISSFALYRIQESHQKELL